MAAAIKALAAGASKDKSMTEYSQMSDFEINKAVAFHIGLSTVIFAENGEFSPCKTPADAWSIIVENKISINHDKHSGWSASSDFVFTTNGEYRFDKVCDHENPLRAAMIVFLMMQDAENANS